MRRGSAVTHTHESIVKCVLNNPHQLALQSEPLKVARVVKDLLSLPTNGQHGLHSGGWVFASQRFSSQHYPVHPIQNSIGYICGFCSVQRS